MKNSVKLFSTTALATACLVALPVAAGVTSIVFDRNGFKFHGRVKALADGC